MSQRLRSLLVTVLLTLAAAGLVSCGGPKATGGPSPYAMQDPIEITSPDLTVRLVRILQLGDEDTLIEDPGWSECIMEIKNLSSGSIRIENVKLLNQSGRYVDSAGAYAQIIAPPDVGTELAGDMAETAAGIAVGQVIPYGGTILGLFSGAARASSAGDRARTQMTFMMRRIKNVELAPAGWMAGSAFLPNISSPKSLVVDYWRNGSVSRVEIPLPLREI